MNAKRVQRGFTLMEILMVIGIIGLVMLIVLPSIGKLFAGEADNTARNLIDAQLKAARSLAVRDRTCTGVHFQRHHATGEFWTAIVQFTEEDPTAFIDDWVYIGTSAPANVPCSDSSALRMAANTQPMKIPGGIGVGLIDPYLGDSYQDLQEFEKVKLQMRAPAPGDPDVFSSFTVMFDPEGRLTTLVDGGTAPFVRKVGADYYCSPMFHVVVDPPPTKADEIVWIWKLQPYVDTYVKAVCVFDSTVLDLLPYGGNASNVGTKEYYLNENAQFLPVAPYVGGLIRTATD